MADGAQPANVIWIFGDQHRAQALGCMGDPNVRTPNLDLMANQGFLSTGAVAGCPLCSPFRGSLLTSRYPHEAVFGHDRPMPEGLPSVADAFNAHGFDTAYFGKWHVDGPGEEPGDRGRRHYVKPDRRLGFKTWLGYSNNNAQWQTWLHGHDQDHGEREPWHLDGYETDQLTDLLIDYLSRRATEGQDPADGEDEQPPFFAAMSVQPPHDPYVAPAKFMANYRAADIKLRPNVPDVKWARDQALRDLPGYYAMIENLDWNVGRIRAALQQYGLSENTYLVFFSDHGDMHASHGHQRKHLPYEESLRIPLIIAGPKPYYGDRIGTDHVVFNHVDFAPTSLGLAGIDKPDWMRGHDYSSLVRGDRPAHDPPTSAYCQLVTKMPGGRRPWRAVVTTDGWKYATTDGAPWLLHNVFDDPYEQTNLVFVPRFMEKRREMHALLEQWAKDVDDPFEFPEAG